MIQTYSVIGVLTSGHPHLTDFICKHFVQCSGSQLFLFCDPQPLCNNFLGSHLCLSTFLDLIAINYVYARGHTYKLQYNLNLVFKLFHGPTEVYHGPQEVGNHWSSMLPRSTCRKRLQIHYCLFRQILTFGIRSVRSPAKVGLVITKLLTTSLVVSWRGWETPPPLSTTAQLSFFA